MAAFVPAGTGFYRVIAGPRPIDVVDLLRNKILDPHQAPERNTDCAPTVTTHVPEAGNIADFETRIDQLPIVESTSDRWTQLQNLCGESGAQAILEIESSVPYSDGVFTTFPAAIVLRSAQSWDAGRWKTVITTAFESQVTTSGLGLAWEQKKDYAQINGLIPFFLSQVFQRAQAESIETHDKGTSITQVVTYHWQ